MTEITIQHGLKRSNMYSNLMHIDGNKFLITVYGYDAEWDRESHTQPSFALQG